MAKVAMLTTSALVKGLDHPQYADYFPLADKIMSALTLDDGFLGTSGFEEDSTWGEWVVPKMYQADDIKESVIQTLSLWRDLESLFAFSYNGIHAEALRRRSQWIPKMPLPNNVIWWLDDDHRPTWGEGATRYDHLAEDGASPTAFNFRQVYSADGQSITLDQDLIKQKAQRYK